VNSNNLWNPGTLDQVDGTHLVMAGAVIGTVDAVPTFVVPDFETQVGLTPRIVAPGSAWVLVDGVVVAEVLSYIAAGPQNLNITLSAALPEASTCQFMVRPFSPSFSMPNGMQFAGAAILFSTV
jgi:hypothetical protein